MHTEDFKLLGIKRGECPQWVMSTIPHAEKIKAKMLTDNSLPA